jgi:flagellar FliL protein
VADEQVVEQESAPNDEAAPEAQGAPDTGQKAPMSRKKRMMVIGIVFAVQVPLVILIGQKLIKPRLVSDEPVEVTEPSDDVRGTIMMLDDITVNLRGSRGSRFLRLAIGLEIEDDRVIGEIEARRPEIRDVVITSVSGRRVDQLISVEGKERLKEELKEKIDAKLQEGSVLKVYFSDFVVQ